MLRWRNTALLATLGIGLVAAQPALTTVQDTLYRADGTRFTGSMTITYNSFQSGGGPNVATANLTLQIVNGSLRVQLVPTTTASAGAQYSVMYNSRGINQFTEIWAVPPSTVTMRVRDVRVTTGVVVGPPPVTTPVQIPDVVGLQNELAIRPMKGIGFGIGRAAVINQAGQIDAAAGNLSDCVLVDGSSGPCGGSGGGVAGSFADGEIPTGLVNGVNAAYALTAAPSPAASLSLFRNGLLMRQGTDYLIAGSAITFFSVSIPQTGDLLTANYRFANPSNPLGSLATPQVVCSSVGISTSATALTQLGSCTLPAGLLGAGDRIEVQFHYLHTGTTTGFTGVVRIGTTTVVSRAAAASETLLVGNSSFGLGAGAQIWNMQTWGSALSLLPTAGTSAEITSAALTVSFSGQLAGATADSLALRNFTVVRYPAQYNP
jgi:hypothetical protein